MNWIAHRLLASAFETPDDVPTVVVDCLSRPSSMAIDEKTGTLFITEPFEGRIVTVPVAP